MSISVKSVVVPMKMCIRDSRRSGPGPQAGGGGPAEAPREMCIRDRFFKVSRAAFAQRRKTAANSISATLGLPKPQVEDALEAAGAEKNVRAERLSLEQLAGLSNCLLA